MSSLLLAAPVSPYIGDFTTPETKRSRGPETPGATGWRRYPGSAQAAFWTVAELFGSPLSNDPAKSATYQVIGQSCGVITDLTNTTLTGEVRLRVKPETKSRALDMIAACRAANSISPAVAGKLRGLLGYVTGLSTNGRAALQPLSTHQYGHSCTISPALAGSLTFVEKLFSQASMDYVIRGIDRRPEKATVLCEASWKPQPPLLHGRGYVSFFVFFSPTGPLC